MPSTVLGDQFVTIGVGTTAERPVSPITGMTRYNTTLASVEIYNGSAWVPVSVSAYNVLSVDSNGNLIHNQILGTEADTSVPNIDNALSAFFSNRLTLAVDSLGNLTATY